MNRAQEISLKISKYKREVLPSELIAVTKYSPVEEVVYAYHSEQLDFGENRVQDLTQKAKYFEAEGLNLVRWHMIGHLQTNKVRDLLRVPNLYAVHSIDSLKLLEEFMKRKSEFRGQHLKLFLQVNTSHEDEKSGFESLHEVKEAIELIKNDSIYEAYGLMTMATVRCDNKEEEAHRCFLELLKIKEELNNIFHKEFKLSMGMSQDYHVAKIYHTNFVRIGSAIFE